MIAAFATAVVTSACLNFDAFGCQDATQCDAEPMGQCEEVGYCSYPDLVCLTGYRYETNAGDGLGGECVDPVMATGGTDPSEVTTDPPPDTDDPSTGSTTGPDPDSGTDDDPTTTGDDCGGAGQDCCAADSCNDGLSCSNGVCGCIASIAVGDRHSCAVKIDGSVWCWGDNTLAQLAMDPLITTSPVPVQIPGFGPAAPVSSVHAANHNCARLATDTVQCWGDNVGRKANPITVLPTVILPEPVTLSASVLVVGVGGTHTCAGLSGGSAPNCWGANDLGQITGDLMATPGPNIIGGGFTPNTVELGLAHTCMSTLGGELYCWGDNAFGQLADPLMGASSSTPLTVPIAPIGQMVTGANHTCAQTGSTVMCWGLNDMGQVGDGTQVNAMAPTTVVFPPEAGVVTTLVAASDQTCAITGAGDLYCWGGNQFGEILLEPDKMGQDGFALSPQVAATGFAVAQLATGVTHSCALSTTGQMLCWGENGQGQIGDGTMSDAQDPTPVDLSCP